MDTIKIIEKLAQIARAEILPQFDVANDVMTRIDLLEQAKPRLWPIEVFAGISAVAASIVTFFSIQAWQYIVNPLFQLFTPYQGGFSLLW